jgi:hypothetical protein
LDLRLPITTSNDKNINCTEGETMTDKFASLNTELIEIEELEQKLAPSGSLPCDIE